MENEIYDGSNTSNILSESIEFTIVKGAILTTLGVVALLGNLMVVFSILLPKKMRSPTNYLLFNLAVLDIITVTIRLPIHLINIMENRQAIDDPLCHFHAFLTGVCFIGSVYSMVGIAVFRYIVVCRSLSVKLSNRHALYAIGLIWLITVFIALWPFWGWSKFVYDPRERACIPSYSEGISGLINGILEIFLDFGIPLTTIFVCYWKIYRYIRATHQRLASFRESANVKHEYRKRRVTLTMWIVFVAFFILYAPWSIMAFVVFPVTNGQANVPDGVYFMAQALLYSNSAANPIIYGVMMGQFKRQYKKVITCGCLTSNEQMIQSDTDAERVVPYASRAITIDWLKAMYINCPIY
ncbi:Melatonin receptor type 1A [Trichoplax sp. H2]|uniref:G-protein coupled receptors family 1 profile domain-containing protein n=1 Tax=Trichoplax adhaerens TaxID=10228 RepID=B3S3G4_TRIAD|nr:hypothetical protein TRIADDRAFT_58712 [Trichoplax adhaerens]EDV22964.1 hypothetical protein TRIADDRAFT_58712 [Trichoplax adhaerens]RDD42345.1 Melatonin receptor type 1A [Trichoplax sp. H2]|eukprot:XP_002114830.1 hypothetical protein TRIADDRAFT_58712 [Trichoplax adhaerens]